MGLWCDGIGPGREEKKAQIPLSTVIDGSEI